LRQLLLYNPLIVLRSYHIDILHGNEMRKPVECLLDQGLTCMENIKKLFRIVRPAHGPEPASYASGHDGHVVILFHEMGIIVFFGRSGFQNQGKVGRIK